MYLKRKKTINIFNKLVDFVEYLVYKKQTSFDNIHPDKHLTVATIFSQLRDDLGVSFSKT